MTTAFQSNAFQDDAFQIDGGQVVVVTPTTPRGSGGWRKVVRRGGRIYWPKKISKKMVEEIIEEVVEEAGPEIAPETINFGALADRIMLAYSPGMIRALEAREAVIAMIKRELEEQDDEEAIMWLLGD